MKKLRTLQRALPASVLAALVALGTPVFASDADAPAKVSDAGKTAKPSVATDIGPPGHVIADTGEQVYTHICQGCHMPDGRGAVGAGHYPAFAKNPAIASSRYMAVTILNGRRNMPAFARPHGENFFFPAPWLSDEQIAGVINHIRTHFGNDYQDPITADEVRALHLTEAPPAAPAPR